MVTAILNHPLSISFGMNAVVRKMNGKKKTKEACVAWALLVCSAIIRPRDDHAMPNKAAIEITATTPSAPPLNETPRAKATRTMTSAWESALVPAISKLPKRMENRLIGARSSLSKYPERISVNIANPASLPLNTTACTRIMATRKAS